MILSYQRFAEGPTPHLSALGFATPLPTPGLSSKPRSKRPCSSWEILPFASDQCIAGRALVSYYSQRKDQAARLQLFPANPQPVSAETFGEAFSMPARVPQPISAYNFGPKDRRQVNH